MKVATSVKEYAAIKVGGCNRKVVYCTNEVCSDRDGCNRKSVCSDKDSCSNASCLWKQNSTF